MLVFKGHVVAPGVDHKSLTKSPVLNLGPVSVKYVVGKVALGQVFPSQYCSTSAPYSPCLLISLL